MKERDIRNTRGLESYSCRRDYNVLRSIRNEFDARLWESWRDQIYRAVQGVAMPEVLEEFMEFVDSLDRNQMLKLHRFIQSVRSDALVAGDGVLRVQPKGEENSGRVGGGRVPKVVRVRVVHKRDSKRV